MPTAYYIVPAIIILAIIGAAVYGRFAAKTRRGTIRSVAATMGFSYVAEDPAVLDQFAALGAPFDLGFDRRATNVLVGSWDGRPAIAWDYSYKTRSSGKNNSTVPHDLGIVCIRTRRDPRPDPATPTSHPALRGSGLRSQRLVKGFVDLRLDDALHGAEKQGQVDLDPDGGVGDIKGSLRRLGDHELVALPASADTERRLQVVQHGLRPLLGLGDSEVVLAGDVDAGHDLGSSLR